MDVGFIGIGNMGWHMARNLCAKGYRVTVCDVDKSKCELLAQQCQNVTVSTNAEGVAAASDVIITMLPDANCIKQVVYAADGILAGITAGKVLIDMSSSVPKVTKEICRDLRQKGADMLDAPVSGGVSGAEKGTLTIMAGGEEAVFEKYKKVLLDLGSKAILVGDIGSGHAVKAFNNLLSATTMWITGEVMAMGVKAGLKPEKMLEVINISTGRSNSSEGKFPNFVLNRKFNLGFSGMLTLKDVKIATSIGDDLQVPLILSNLVEQLWSYGLTVKPDMDQTEIVKIIENMAGVTIQGEGE